MLLEIVGVYRSAFAEMLRLEADFVRFNGFMLVLSDIEARLGCLFRLAFSGSLLLQAPDALQFQLGASLLYVM